MNRSGQVEEGDLLPTKTPAPPPALAWELEDGSLYPGAESTRERLEESCPPTPGAKIVAVRIVPNIRYRELLKAERAVKGLVPSGALLSWLETYGMRQIGEEWVRMQANGRRPRNEGES